MNATSLQAYIRGFYRDRRNELAPGSLSLAQPLQIDALAGGYWYLVSDERYDARKGAASAINADFDRADESLAVVSVATANRKSKFSVLPDELLESVDSQSGQSQVDAAILRHIDYLHGAHVADTIASATASLASDTLDISVPTTAVRRALMDLILARQAASGLRPNCIYMGEEAVNAFLELDEFQSGVALAAAASPTVERRTGAADMTYAASWFRSKLGLELITESTTGILASGSAGFLAGSTAILAHTAPGGNRATLKTVHMPGDEAMIRVHTSRTSLPLSPGVGVACSAQYKVEATEPASGVVLTLTLPS